mgnify:CR=1 FL=1
MLQLPFVATETEVAARVTETAGKMIAMQVIATTVAGRPAGQRHCKQHHLLFPLQLCIKECQPEAQDYLPLSFFTVGASYAAGTREQ